MRRYVLRVTFRSLLGVDGPTLVSDEQFDTAAEAFQVVQSFPRSPARCALSWYRRVLITVLEFLYHNYSIVPSLYIVYKYLNSHPMNIKGRKEASVRFIRRETAPTSADRDH